VSPSLTWKPWKNLSVNVTYNYDYEKYNQLAFTTFGSNEFLQDYANPPAVILNSLGLTAAQARARWQSNEVAWAGDVQAATGEVPYWLANYQTFLAPEGAKFNPGGPDAYEKDINSTLTSEIVYRLNDYLSFRYGFLASNVTSSYLLPNMGLNNGDGTIAINPQAGYADHEVITHQIDALIKADLPFVKNKIVVGYQYARNTSQNTDDAVDLAAYPLGGAQALQAYNPYTMPPVRLSLLPLTPEPDGSYGSNNVIESGYTVSWAGSWFDGRLNTLAGIRADKNENKPIGAPALAPVYTKDNLPMVGATFRVVKDVSLFASYSKTYTPTTTMSITGPGVLPSDNPHVLPPETGSGYDIGFKVDALDGHLSGTLTYFEDERTGIASEDLAARVADPRNSAANGGFSGPKSVDYFVAGGLERTKGIEADVIYSVNKNYSLIFSGSYMPVARTITDPGTTVGSYDYDIEILGKRRLVNAPEQMAAFWNKYSFTTGPLKNFSVGAGVHYSSEVMDQQNYLWYLEDPSFVTLEAMVAYHLSIGGREVSFQVNGKNLTNVYYYQGGVVAAPPREVYFNTEIKF
jgi:outer membrane receptor protein involved in Fe transport